MNWMDVNVKHVQEKYKFEELIDSKRSRQALAEAEEHTMSRLRHLTRQCGLSDAGHLVPNRYRGGQ